MDDQYGLPSDLRHLSGAAQQPSSSIFPALTHRNMTSSSNSQAVGNNNVNYQLPFSTTTFPLVSGGGLVMDSNHFSHHHHYHHNHNHNDHFDHQSGVWNNIGNIVDGNNNNNNNNNTIINGGDQSSNNNCRWPRQETLTLLEIRSRLNSKFKDTNQKAPLWDEISRIMAEEHGYHRSGKKCKEKFENLYKYYKKTKEGKAGRQDGKHYRFFRQLEAIYGGDQSSGNNNNNNIQSTSSLLETQYLGRNSPLLYDPNITNVVNRATNNHETLSFSVNSTEFETSSSDNNNNEDDLSAIAFKGSDDRKMKGLMSSSSASWKVKIEGFVDSQMRKVAANQETWMERMVRSVIGREEERAAKEDEWRRREAARLERESSEFWARERAWVESRDVALMSAFKSLNRGKEINSLLELPSFPHRMAIGRDHESASYQRWSEEEISSLIDLRTSMETTMLEGNNLYYGGNNNNNNNNSNMNRDGVWEEIASKMVCLGFGRTPNECREKWKSVSLYVTMTSECKKKRREDYYKTSGYYFEGQTLEQKQETDQVIIRNNNNNSTSSNNNNNNNNNVLGLQLMDEGHNSPSSSNVASSSQMHPNNFFHLLFGEGENLWEKYGTLKLGKR